MRECSHAGRFGGLRAVNAGAIGATYRKPMTRIRFHGELNDLVPRRARNRPCEFRSAENATLKHAIEAFGVPHTEVGTVLVHGAPAPLDRRVEPGDTIDVHPAPAVEPADGPPESAEAPLEPAGARAQPAERPAFLADAHLGGLARRLRLLGFDTLLADDAPDEMLAERVDGDGRVLLSRDRELLKHRKVLRGRYVRAQRTDEQAKEVIRHFGLAPLARPFSRCLECNAPLRSATRQEVLERLPPDVAATHDAFTFCTGCGRVYWPGSHWRRLQAVVRALISEAPR
ncbi:Mut7-C ubiquitin/RNAse domain-containing protein [Burkholderiaceae bacterium FT117]|uniref:Mut7-C RNAse domain-containing protein n=1 Tax=Zeimonas sediminis TaxID=2944268 RepID=UPI00234319C2|nr:Mut7-C RNAse domain-containing protein [Zeimonas sediminis]MCM5569272.1 Mut7-C ubiquitin/RNAse domain-containing protein [Zeimonas sediminis]